MKNSFYEKEEYTLNDLKELIKSGIEESSRLEYKSSGSLSKGDKDKSEIAKDVSAFANSDGGIIVYGITEENHKPTGFSFIDGSIYTKEWLENVIDGNIKQIIQNIEIHPIRVDDQIEKSIYIVKIPVSSDAPHMAADKKFYRRYNFKSVSMDEYEVRLLYFRTTYTELETTTISMYDKGIHTDDAHESRICKELSINVRNVSQSLEKNYKIEVSFEGVDQNTLGFTYERNSNISHSKILDKGVILSAFNLSPIFPGEEVQICKFTLRINQLYYAQFCNDAVLSFKLFYSHGHHISSVKFSELMDSHDNSKLA